MFSHSYNIKTNDQQTKSLRMLSLLLEENMKVDGCGPVNIRNSLILLKMSLTFTNNIFSRHQAEHKNGRKCQHLNTHFPHVCTTTCWTFFAVEQSSHWPNVSIN